jgi:hypothetical protein
VALVETFEVVGTPLCFDYFFMRRVRHFNLRMWWRSSMPAMVTLVRQNFLKPSMGPIELY